MARVRRDRAAGEITTAHVVAARGEAEGFPIVVKAPAGAAITRLAVAASALVGPGGKTIPAEDIEIYRAMYQIVKLPSGSGDPPRKVAGSAAFYLPSHPDGPAGSGTPNDPGNGSMCGAGRPFGPPPCEIPDGLVPYKRCSDGSAPPCPGDPGVSLQCAIDGNGCGTNAPSMTVPPGMNQQLWVEMTVPRGAERCPAGIYKGLVTITTNAGVGRIRIALRVWDFDLPLAPSFRTGFGSNTAPPAARRAYGWVQNEQAYLAKHRISSVRYGGGPADVGAYRRVWTTLQKTWGVPNAIGAAFWPGVSSGACTREGRSFPSAAEIELWIASEEIPPNVIVYVHDGDEVFKEYQARCNGSMYRSIRAGARVVHATRAKLLTVVNPVAELSYQHEDGSGPPAVDIFVASPREMFRESPKNLNYRGQDIVEKVTAAGSSLWTYNIWVKDSWGPKWLLDYSPVAYRLGFIAQALGISGALVAEYWTLSQSDENPWVEGVFSMSEGGNSRSGPMNGDSQFIYPGAPVGLGTNPTAHLRLKMLRDGIEDYELIQILKTIGGGAAYSTTPCGDHHRTCKAVVEALGGSDYSDYSTDTHALQRARAAIGDAIHAHPDRPRS